MEDAARGAVEVGGVRGGVRPRLAQHPPRQPVASRRGQILVAREHEPEMQRQIGVGVTLEANFVWTFARSHNFTSDLFACTAVPCVGNS